MEYQYDLRSPSWLLENDKQDFCNGAKASTSQYPVYLTPPSSYSSSDLVADNEWVELLSPLDDYQPLTISDGDFILPQSPNFGNDELFRDLTDIDNFHSVEPVNEEVLVASPPKITIKLKKIKYSKSPKLNQSEFYSNDSLDTMQFQVIPPPCNVVSPEETLDQLLQEQSVLMESNLDDADLKEMMSLEETEKIIDGLLMDLCPNNGNLLNYNAPFESNVELCDEPLHNDALDNQQFMDDSIEVSVIDESPLFDSLSPSSDFSNFASSPSSFVSSSSYNSDFGDFSISDEVNVASTSKCSTKDRKKTKKLKSAKNKYERKKEQNKMAALKYRLKKKNELHELSLKIKEEELTNEKLRKEETTVKQEINFLRKLLRETFLGSSSN